MASVPIDRAAHVEAIFAKKKPLGAGDLQYLREEIGDFVALSGNGAPGTAMRIQIELIDSLRKLDAGGGRLAWVGIGVAIVGVVIATVQVVLAFVKP